MDNARSFKEFLATQSPHVPLADFAVNLILSAAVAFCLAKLYEAYGRSLSNRRIFARNFLPLATTTMLVITIVKSSLALSLGLVGALSIVRFRAAIKEPEELSFLFLAIGTGLGFGADQRAVTLSAVAFIACCLIGRDRFFASGEESPNLFLTVSAGAKVPLDAILGAVKEHASAASVVRLDEGPNGLEAAFHVSFGGVGAMTSAKEALRRLDPDLSLSFVKDESSSM